MTGLLSLSIPTGCSVEKDSVSEEAILKEGVTVLGVNDWISIEKGSVSATVD